MKKYMAMYMAPAATIAKAMKMPEADTKAFMNAWMKWSETHAKGIVDGGTPLGKTRTVSSSGTSDTHNDLTGYSIVQADSPAAVEAMFKDHPHLRMEGATIDIMPCTDMSAMN